VWYLITVGLKQTWFNVIRYPLRYKYVNQTAPCSARVMNRRAEIAVPDQQNEESERCMHKSSSDWPNLPVTFWSLLSPLCLCTADERERERGGKDLLFVVFFFSLSFSFQIQESRCFMQEPKLPGQRCARKHRCTFRCLNSELHCTFCETKRHAAARTGESEHLVFFPSLSRVEMAMGTRYPKSGGFLLY
jgi:hypothetical protein